MEDKIKPIIVDVPDTPTVTLGIIDKHLSNAAKEIVVVGEDNIALTQAVGEAIKQETNLDVFLNEAKPITNIYDDIRGLLPKVPKVNCTKGHNYTLRRTEDRSQIWQCRCGKTLNN